MVASNILDQVYDTLPRWLARAPKLKVLYPIVCSVTVDVMDILAIHKHSAKMALHHETVLGLAAD